MKISLATTSDTDVIRTIKPTINKDTVRERLERQLKGEVEWLLLNDNNNFVGFVLLKWQGKPTQPNYPDIEDLYIADPYRNLGYGKKLIAECEKRAITKGFKKIGLAVNPTENKHAKKLYEKLGYHAVGAQLYLDGVYNGHEDWCIDLEKDLILSSTTLNTSIPLGCDDLIQFASNIVEICKLLSIDPILTGSLAIYAYTQNASLQIHDVDLSCHENDFPKLTTYFDQHGIDYKLKDWHVLQVWKDGMKVEFDSIEHWMPDLPDTTNQLVVGDLIVKIVNPDYLYRLYQIGYDNTFNATNDTDRDKHEKIKQKLQLLDEYFLKKVN